MTEGCSQRRLLLFALVVHVNPRSRVLIRPGSGGGDLQPSHWRRIVAPRFKSFKARWCGVQRQAAVATRGGSAFTVGGAPKSLTMTAEQHSSAKKIYER